MNSPTIIGSAPAVARYHELKNVPHEKMQKMLLESRAATVRLLEERVQAEKQSIAERERRLGPVYRELASAMRKSPDLKSVVKAIDSIERRDKRQPLAPDKSSFAARIPRFAPRMPMVRQGSIHIVDSPPFWTDTWTWQEGDSNDFVWEPFADGSAGFMGFEMSPGQTSSGHMACSATVGGMMALPNSPCLVEFTTVPSYYWAYIEDSNWWRQAAGNMWIGQQIVLFSKDGISDIPIVNQNTLASFDDRNFNDADYQTSGGSFVSPSITIPLLSFALVGDSIWQGGFVAYNCSVGGSCNADGSNDQSSCHILMTATCPNMIIDIIEF